jgi:hypothetical protein
MKARGELALRDFFTRLRVEHPGVALEVGNMPPYEGVRRLYQISGCPMDNFSINMDAELAARELSRVMLKDG